MTTTKRAGKHRKGQESSLSREDRRALELLEGARLQYERYRELQETAAVLPIQEPSDPPVPDWHHPLTLVLRG